MMVFGSIRFGLVGFGRSIYETKTNKHIRQLANTRARAHEWTDCEHPRLYAQNIAWSKLSNFSKIFSALLRKYLFTQWYSSRQWSKFHLGIFLFDHPIIHHIVHTHVHTITHVYQIIDPFISTLIDVSYHSHKILFFFQFIRRTKPNQPIETTIKKFFYQKWIFHIGYQIANRAHLYSVEPTHMRWSIIT